MFITFWWSRWANKTYIERIPSEHFDQGNTRILQQWHQSWEGQHETIQLSKVLGRKPVTIHNRFKRSPHSITSNTNFQTGSPTQCRWKQHSRRTGRIESGRAGWTWRTAEEEQIWLYTQRREDTAQRWGRGTGQMSASQLLSPSLLQSMGEKRKRDISGILLYLSIISYFNKFCFILYTDLASMPSLCVCPLTSHSKEHRESQSSEWRQMHWYTS